MSRWNELMAGLVGQYKDLLGDGAKAEITNYPNFEHLEAKGRDPQSSSPVRIREKVGS